MRSMMDILAEKSQELQSTDTDSLILAQADEVAPVIKRLNLAMDFLVKDVMDNPRTSRKAKFMFSKLWQEAIMELQEVAPEIVEEQFSRTTALMHWVSTGQVIENIPMPDGFWDTVGAEIPQLSAHQPPELEAGVSVE